MTTTERKVQRIIERMKAARVKAIIRAARKEYRHGHRAQG